MKYLINNCNDPYYNMAFEEYVFKNIKPDKEYFYLWQNKPVVVIGKNQNTSEEVNKDFIKENNIEIVRRITGGGAVFHDFGNINFTFIIQLKNNLKEVNFKDYTQPVIDALKELGVNAELSGRNDILLDGKKISGNSQRQENKILLHHGTLIYDLNIESMVKSLNVCPEKFISKAYKSVRSRVTNLKEHLGNITLEELKKHIHRHLSKGDEEIVLTEKDYENIEKLKKEKYLTWEWNYGFSPKFNYKNKKKLNGGFVDVLINIENGLISNIRFFGDYIGLKDIEELEKKLIGKRYEKKDITEELDKFKLYEYFGIIKKEEIIDLIFEN